MIQSIVNELLLFNIEPGGRGQKLSILPQCAKKTPSLHDTSDVKILDAK